MAASTGDLSGMDVAAVIKSAANAATRKTKIQRGPSIDGGLAHERRGLAILLRILVFLQAALAADLIAAARFLPGRLR